MQEKRSNLDCSRYKTVCTSVDNYKCEIEVVFFHFFISTVHSAHLIKKTCFSPCAEVCMPRNIVDQVLLG